MDLLWSDPTDNTDETGIVANTDRDPSGSMNIVKFGQDRIEKFLKSNYHSLILRSH